LCGAEVLEDPTGEELGSKGAMEPLDLAGGGRAPRGRQQVVDPVLAADPVEQDLGVGGPEPAGEDLAVEFPTDVKLPRGL
jgi:hypothetical protein